MERAGTMIRIRTKIMIYSLILVVLLNSVAFFLFHNSQKSIDQYNELLQRFFLLNEVSQHTNNVYQALNAYLVERSPEHLARYKRERQQLNLLRTRLKNQLPQQSIPVKNYQNLITSFLDESEIVIDAFKKQQLTTYSTHLSEAQNISRFIQEMTLTLINDELTNYQTFYHDMNEQHQLFQAMGISIFASTMIFSVIFALWFSDGMTRPIRLLSSAAKEISLGHFDGKEVRVTTNDEFRLLTDTFNRMRSNIRQLVQEIKQKSELDKLLKEMELKSLQSQINPHFLFNTLNTVSKLAYIEGAEKTSDLLHSISALLRYNLGDLNKPTTLKEEVAVVQEYFFIQQTRFGERVQFSTSIDESCLAQPIPSLTLQPLVENAFIHGIEGYETDALLTLTISSHPDHVRVQVTDNGVGMDEETKRQLLSKDADRVASASQGGHSTGIGFKNVRKRLELFYGQEDLVTIESAPNRGTTITLRLPVRHGKEEPRDVYHSDR
ncbi:sensor histidine kinase [Laceyella putida]|uniref:histidine kinase n=1 Tax=Laceyella putida TaxID=110101 RepID=A0ABW2RJR1_9BACL